MKSEEKPGNEPGAAKKAATIRPLSPAKERRRQMFLRLIDEAGSQTKLADIVGIPTTHVSAVALAKRGIGDDLAGKIERAFDKPHGWLDGIDFFVSAPGKQNLIAVEIKAPKNAAPIEAKGPISLVDNPAFAVIPMVKMKLRTTGAVGYEIEFLEEEANAPIVFHRDWLRSRKLDPSRLYALRVESDAMEPSLYEGDTVVINTESIKPAEGRVFAIDYEGDLLLRRLHRDAGEWWLRADHPTKTRHPDKRLHDDIRLIGEIVHRHSDRI